MLDGDLVSTLIQLSAIFLIFYIILIRPQQKKLKEHEALLGSLKTGDKIITGGGIYAKVLKVEDLEVTAEISKGVEVVLYKTTIRDVISDEKASSKAKKAPAKIKKAEVAKTKTIALKSKKTTTSKK